MQRPQPIRSHTSDKEWKYRKDFRSMGDCVIINNKNFLDPKTPDRKGTEKDVAAATKAFGDLGYNVTVYNNLTKEKMELTMKKAAHQNHSQKASFVCVILSHGSEGSICGTDGCTALINLTKYFKGDQCETLVEKPKLFFIQACRVMQKNPGKEGEVVEKVEHSCGPHKIPVDADFFYAYATDPGHYAWRDQSKGSWFIQSLCEILSEHRDLELLHIMTRVNRRVAFDFQTKVGGIKEIPCFTSMLTKEFYFL